MHKHHDSCDSCCESAHTTEQQQNQSLDLLSAKQEDDATPEASTKSPFSPRPTSIRLAIIPRAVILATTVYGMVTADRLLIFFACACATSIACENPQALKHLVDLLKELFKDLY